MDEKFYGLCADYLESMANRVFAADSGLHVSVGGSTVQQPDEFVIHELPEAVSIQTRSTSIMGKSGERGEYRIEFSVPIETWSKRAGFKDASYLAMERVGLFIGAVAADRTLGGLCVLAEPYISNAGTAYESNKAIVVAGVDMGVRIKAGVDPAKDFTKE